MSEAAKSSGKRTKRDIVCWALEEAIRQQALAELLARRVKVHFDVTPDEMEKWEVREQYGARKRRGVS